MIEGPCCLAKKWFRDLKREGAAVGSAAGRIAQELASSLESCSSSLSLVLRDPYRSCPSLSHLAKSAPTRRPTRSTLARSHALASFSSHHLNRNPPSRLCATHAYDTRS